MKKILLVQTNYPGFLKDFDQKLKKTKNSYSKMKQLWDKEWFGQGNFYSKRLEPFGWQVEELIINDFVMQSQWAAEHRLMISQDNNWLFDKLPESIKNYLGLRGWMKKILFKQIEVLKPDVVYMHDLSILGVDDLRFIKKKVKLLAGQIACPLPLNRAPLGEYDLIVSSFPHYVKMFRKMGIGSEYLRWCFEDGVRKEIKTKKRDLGAVFVGGFSSAHSKGNRVLENLAENVRLDVWGYGINQLGINSPLKKHYNGELWGREMYDMMARAKIVVNRHINVAGNIANNMRMFDATGMGALLITDQKPNMSEFFEVGKEVVTYKNAEDLVKKVKYYLKHDDERDKIARAGQKRTLKDHTYKIRMKELSNILKKYL